MLEFANELVGLVVAVLLIGIIAAPLYRFRKQVKRWITDDKYGCIPMGWEQDAVIRAERAVIKAKWRVEDAESYLEYQKKKSIEKEAETGGD